MMKRFPSDTHLRSTLAAEPAPMSPVKLG